MVVLGGAKGLAAGGGGYYGGFAYQSAGYGTDASGGGGSGYIGGVENGTMQTGVRAGAGYAKITVI